MRIITSPNLRSDDLVAGGVVISEADLELTIIAQDGEVFHFALKRLPPIASESTACPPALLNTVDRIKKRLRTASAQPNDSNKKPNVFVGLCLLGVVLWCFVCLAVVCW